MNQKRKLSGKWSLEDLQLSEKEIGQIYPVILNDKGEILDGFHRKRAVKGWKEVTLPVTDELESLRIRILLNVERRTVPKKEKQEWVKEARKILQLRGSKGTQQEIANSLGMSQGWISEYDVEPTQSQPKPKKNLSGVDKFPKYNVFGFKSKNTLKNNIKKRVIEGISKSLKKEERKEVIKAVDKSLDKINPFFFVQGADPNQPDVDWYHGSTPAFVIKEIIEIYKPKNTLDSMAGMGTTGYVCKEFKIPCDQYDVYPYKKYGVMEGDAERIDSGKVYDLIFNHIPYWGMVRYGGEKPHPEDLSCMGEEEFFKKLKKIFERNFELLSDNGVYAILSGDWRSGGRLVPITARTTMIGLETGFKLWDSAIKLTSEMKGKQLQEYRAMKYGYLSQMYDTVLMFKKVS